jgi:hypothetical protein
MAAAPCNVPTTTRRSRPIVAPPQPSYLRAGASEALGEGWAGGTIGPFGSEVFALPNGSGTLRLDIPAAAPTAGVIGRSVEGPGGAGRAAIATQNLALEGPRERDFAWDSKRPARTDFTVSVPEPAAGTNSARIRLTVQRNADRVGDAVQINLPIRPDRPVVHRRDLLAVDASGRLDFSALADPARPASLARTVTLASDPAVVKLIAGANALTRPAVGGTEQRLALARAELALLPFTPLMDATGRAGRVTADVNAAVAAVKLSTDDDGLVAFFPHVRGSVWLTASALRLVAAGMELLNPALATAVAKATPSAGPSLAPSWSSFGDDEVTAVFLTLPPGTTTLRTRMRATIPGSFTAPPAQAEMLYRLGISDSSAGARVVVAK